MRQEGAWGPKQRDVVPVPAKSFSLRAPSDVGGAGKPNTCRPVDNMLVAARNAVDGVVSSSAAAARGPPGVACPDCEILAAFGGYAFRLPTYSQNNSSEYMVGPKAGAFAASLRLNQPAINISRKMTGT